MTVLPADLTVSLSAIQAFQRCEQSYFYQYVERLRRKDRAVPLELGSILHDYLSSYYEEVKKGQRPDDAHAIAQLRVSVKYTADVRRYANVALSVGAEELAKELLALPERARQISDRYYAARGKADAELHEVLLNENTVAMRLTSRIVSNGRIDLVTRDRERGLIWLWEHKSTGNIPPLAYRLRDLQTPLYVRKLAESFKHIEVDGCIWNYMRTKEPTVPDLVYVGKKNESLTRRADIDTTWEIYKAEIEAYGLNELDYEEMRMRLEPREKTIFFPRFEQVILADTDLLFRDYKETAKKIARARASWAKGSSQPVRSLTRDCEYCSYKDLCMGVLMSGGDDVIRRMRYRVAGEVD